MYIIYILLGLVTALFAVAFGIIALGVMDDNKSSRVVSAVIAVVMLFAAAACVNAGLSLFEESPFYVTH